jgi:ribosomal-protein-alanine N-acetyltransferase
MSSIFPEILTDRLKLRQIVPADAYALYMIHSDADVMRWYGVDAIKEPAEGMRLAELFNSWFYAGTGYRWALERIDDGRLIGTAGLFRWNKSWHSCVTGYELARDCHGQGYMREAMQDILTYGFNDMDLNRVQAEVHGQNEASIGLALRLGFQLEGIHRENAFWNGQFHDLHCYSLLASEWPHARAYGMKG